MLGSYEFGRGDNANQIRISAQGARHLARVAHSILFNEDATPPTFEEILGNNDMDVFETKVGESALTWPSPAEPYNDSARERISTFNDKLLAPVILWGAEWGHLAGHAMQVLNKINKVVGKILKTAGVKAGGGTQESLWEKAKSIERQKARSKEENGQKNNLRLILRLERHYAQLQAKVTTKRLAGLRYLKRTVPYMLRRFPVKGISYEDLTFQKAGLTAPAGFTGPAAQAMKSMPKRFGDWVAWGFWYLKSMSLLPVGGLRRATVWAGGTSQVCAHHPDPPYQGRIDRQGSADSGVCSVGREIYMDDKGSRQEGSEILISHDSAAGIISFRGHAVLAKKDQDREEKKQKKGMTASDTGPPKT